VERRLAAILAADVVGYSRLMEQDEAATFERLRAHRKELFEPEIERHHGRLFKLMGDGLLAEFGSIVDAVECAVALQRDMAERNAAVAEEQRILVRIGINLGEVIVEGDDRYGEGVNIAARLQQLADPGGICVSGKVAKEVEKKLAFGFEPMGEQHVKNIAEPVQAFRVKLDGMPVRSRSMSKKASRRWVAGIIGFTAVLIVVAGALYLRPPPPPTQQPSIAVLPFANMSGDPAEDYLGPGVAEEIITMLSTYPGVRVVSRTSSFVYDKPVKVQQVAQDLGIAYVLEGSVKKAAGTVHITAQLIDATTGDHVWAERYEEEGSDVVALQVDVANRIFDSIAGLRGEIRKKEEEDAWRKSAPSLEEYDYYLRGHQLYFQFTADGNAKAREIWREGLARFPGSALLRLKIASTYWTDLVNDRSDDPGRDVELAWKLVKEAEAVPDKSRLETWLYHWQMAGYYQFHDGDFERSAAEAEATVKLVPNDPWELAVLSEVMAKAGRTDRAIEWAQQALRDPSALDWYRNQLGWAYYYADRPSDALAEFKKAQQPSNWGLAVSYARLGKLDQARASMADVVKDSPNSTIKSEAIWPTRKQPQMVERLLKLYLEDLRKAGMPE
jgi:class 3 adenylate cyclase/TolB-like protein